MIIKNKVKNLPDAIKASIVFFAASLISKGIAYITTPIYTRLLTSQEYGVVSVFLTWLEIFGIIAMFGLSNGVFNNGMVDYPEKRDEFSFSMLGLSNIITVIFSILLFLGYPFIKEIINLDYSLIVLMCVSFLFKPAYSFWMAKQRYEFKYKASFFWMIFISFISPLFAIIAIKRNDNHAYARIFGAQLPLIIIYFLFYIFLAYKSRWKIDRSYWKGAILFNLPLIPHYLSGYLLNSSDKLMISHFNGDSATAYYSVAYALAAVTFMIWNAANSSLIPFTYDKCKNKKYQDISNITLPIITFFSVTCLIVILFAPEMFKILTTSEYMIGIYVIPPIVGGVFFQAQYDMYANVVYYYKKPKYVMYASIFACCLNILLNYIFIPLYGFIAAGYTTLFSYLVQSVCDHLAMRKVVGQKIYNMKYMFFLSLLVVIISLISGFLYNYTFIRYGFVFVILLGALLFRRRIIHIFKVLKNT